MLDNCGNFKMKDACRSGIKTKVSRSLTLCLGFNIHTVALQYNPSCWFQLQTKVSQLIWPILTILTNLTTQTIQTSSYHDALNCMGVGGGGWQSFDNI